MRIPDGHPLLDRVVADNATDPIGWSAARGTHIGASDAAKFSKIESTELYVRSQILAMHKPFTGNAYTDRGHTYEAAIMRWAGVPENAKTFHHPEIEEFAATPDGVDVTPAGPIVLGEAKVKHRPTKGPTPAERRQVVWAQYVVGSELTKWAWLELDTDTRRPLGEPRMLRIDFDPDLLAPVLTIAHHVRAAMRAAARFERENHR